jgi:WD40 repeat protein
MWSLLHKDFITVSLSSMLEADGFLQELPQELRYQVLSYLDVADLITAKNVSLSWRRICTYPLLWKSHYFEEGWTIDMELMEDFEKRLGQMQSKLDFHFALLPPSESSHHSNGAGTFVSPGSTATSKPPYHEPGDLRLRYRMFFKSLQSFLSCDNPCTQMIHLQNEFRNLARGEIGEPFYKTAMFTPNSNSSVRVHVDWHYLYMNRKELESNWRRGCYQAKLLDGAPDVPAGNQREGIYCVYFDRRYLAAGSRDHRIRVWDMATMQYKKTLCSHEGSVLCLQLDSKRNMMVSGSSDSTIKVWDIELGEVVQTLKGHRDSVLGLHFHDNHMVSCSRDTTARIWALCPRTDSNDPSTNTDIRERTNDEKKPRFSLLHILRGHRAAVNSVSFHKNTIATGSGDRSIRLWNLMDGTKICTIAAHPRGIACVNIVGNCVVTGSSDHVIKLFDVTTGTEIRALRGHSALVRTIQTDNTKIISGSYDHSIRIWDLKTGEMLNELDKRHDSK